MKIAHAADLHLDSALRGLERHDGAPVELLRGATRRALENLIDLCVSEPVDLLLLAGDLYDGDWRDYTTGLFFHRQMARLKSAGIPVVLVRGNHDAQSQITKQLVLPENVRELASKQPETYVLEELGVAVHGQSFAKRAVTDDLALRYPAPLAGYFNVGLLHTCLDGREGHERYAPTTLETLKAKGYDYWALGHVHGHEVLSRDPWIVFPGNLQGRHARELGPKGAMLVTVEDGRVVDAVLRPCDAVRWCRPVVDMSGAASGYEVVDLARAALERELAQAEGRLVAARLSIVGRGPAHAELATDPRRWESALAGVAQDLGGAAVWIERIELRSDAAIDPDELARRDDAVGQVARSLRDLGGDDDRLRVLAETLEDLQRKLPAELASGDDALRFDAAGLRRAMDDVEKMLLPMLVEGER